jgi:hypothetical protein
VSAHINRFRVVSLSLIIAPGQSRRNASFAHFAGRFMILIGIFQNIA